MCVVCYNVNGIHSTGNRWERLLIFCAVWNTQHGFPEVSFLDNQNSTCQKHIRYKWSPKVIKTYYRLHQLFLHGALWWTQKETKTFGGKFFMLPCCTTETGNSFCSGQNILWNKIYSTSWIIFFFFPKIYPVYIRTIPLNLPLP